MMHDKGVLKLSIRDLLYTNYVNGFIQYANVLEHFVQKLDPQSISLVWTYRFGTTAKNQKMKEVKAATEEQERVKLN
jgi:iron complex outermembrane receptor protein